MSESGQTRSPRSCPLHDRSSPESRRPSAILLCRIRAMTDIAELRADIARERVIIEHALDAGYPSAVAESMLHALEGALRIFETHRGLILDELKRRPSE